VNLDQSNWNNISSQNSTQNFTDPTWLLPPEVISLSESEVHVWLADLDAAICNLPELQTTLAADEIARAQRFHFPEHRDRFVLGRGLLRVILAKYLNLEPHAIAFSYGSHGKPFLQEPYSHLSFNLTHSGGLALYIVALRREVGIDAECIERDREIDSIISRFFTQSEQTYLLNLLPAARQTAFFHCWTCKEAQAKASGEGIAQGLDQLDLSSMLEKKHNSIYHAPWTVMSFRLEQDWRDRYAAAIAVTGQDWQIKYWRYQN
jgi:4'-phosphopantetheinyl transferase